MIDNRELKIGTKEFYERCKLIDIKYKLPESFNEINQLIREYNKLVIDIVNGNKTIDNLNRYEFLMKHINQWFNDNLNQR
jgi:hypothetical protein